MPEYDLILISKVSTYSVQDRFYLFPLENVIGVRKFLAKVVNMADMSKKKGLQNVGN